MVCDLSMKKVYITSKQEATFICPQCQRSKTVDVSRYAALERVVKVNVKCPCGHAYTAILEKRKQYRKATNLPGTFIHIVDGRPVNKGLMTVKDISNTGMKLRINVDQKFLVEDLLQVEFHLDDTQRTLIQKKVIIKNINGNDIGTQFSPTETVDQALGFYLFG